jgi:integrase
MYQPSRAQPLPLPPALPIPAQQFAGWASPGAYAMPILPFQFPSLQHLDERYARVLQHAESVDGLSRGSIQAYGFAYKRFRIYLLEHEREAAFVGGDLRTQVAILEEWIGWMRARATSHTTINTYWRNLRAAFVRIAREDGCADPMAFVRTPQPGKRIPRFLTRDALEAVFLFVRHYQWPGGRFEALRNLAILACMALAGLRLGEVLRLKVGDVDLTEQTIKVLRGKGRNGGKDRTAYMPDPLRFVMSEYLTERSRVETSVAEVFVRRDGCDWPHHDPPPLRVRATQDGDSHRATHAEAHLRDAAPAIGRGRPPRDGATRSQQPDGSSALLARRERCTAEGDANGKRGVVERASCGSGW